MAKGERADGAGGKVLGVFMRATLLLLWVQMLGTVTPLIFFPHETFAHIPYAPTLEGQYIIKNIVLVSAGIVIGATVRGGRLTPGAGGPHGSAGGDASDMYIRK